MKNPIKMIASPSRAVEEYGYDAATGTLRIRFRGGKTYEYSGVPGHVFANFTGSGSHGTAFGQLVRGKYKGRRST